jgi:ribonucleoside-diphosphate reductase alpha chain
LLTTSLAHRTTSCRLPARTSRIDTAAAPAREVLVTPPEVDDMVTHLDDKREDARSEFAWTLILHGDEERRSPAPARAGGGLAITRRRTRAGRDPFDDVAWERRKASIVGPGGAALFEQDDVEVPSAWSQTATNVVAHRYLAGAPGTPARERSIKQMIERVVSTIAGWGAAGGTFASPADALAFGDELKHLLVTQAMSFNSPVWFNVGLAPRPQCSACFINSVTDSTESIMALAATETSLFRGGSGTGTNFSAIRSSRETNSDGGRPAGPLPFLRGLDAFARAIQSGGRTRRAAKMVILDAEHPDIVAFIDSKVKEERKAVALIEAGYDPSYTGEAYGSVAFQAGNHSIRVTDELMNAVAQDGVFMTRAVSTGEVVDTLRARDLLRAAATAAWTCGDPGLQFHTTINAWHTSPAGGPIRASNPCSEFMYLDDTACNLASLNLRHFDDPARGFDVESFQHAIEITLLAQEIIVDNASYPTERIRENSVAYRPLGLGFANLGALLMARGLPYDSDAGRALAGAITALMTGHAYLTSARIAAHATGPFPAFPDNRDAMLAVIRKHEAAVGAIDARLVPGPLLAAAREAWAGALELGGSAGFRNGQVTVLAPTGTIAFMMDCDTTGIEPDLALVKTKRLASGGVMKIVNGTVGAALTSLGYEDDARDRIVSFIDQHGAAEGAPDLRPEHLAVFDCALRAQGATRVIEPLGHVRMMAACQPFVSGAISKTVNLPDDATIEDVEKIYEEAWKLGLKAIAVYRDGCKRSQPLSAERKDGRPPPRATSHGPPLATRQTLPGERRALSHKFSIAGMDGFLMVGTYEDGTPGELFIRMAKEGSTISGLMDSFANAVSVALQHGVPLQALCERFRHTRFEPAGFTRNPEIPRATSVIDYIFAWLEAKFGGEPRPMEAPPPRGASSSERRHDAGRGDAPVCGECGSLMVRSGSCHRCVECGATSGCS